MSRINGYASQDVKPLGVTNPNADETRVKTRGPVAGPILAGTGDATQLSAAGAVLAKATAGSDVRTEKVAALQAAIASGTYHVSASDVADKLIGSLLGEQ